MTRDVAASTAAAGVYSVSLGMASLALPLLALAAGFSAVEVGVLAALSAVSQLGVRLVLGRVMRRWSDWTLVAAAGVMLALSCAGAALSATAASLAVAQLLQGASRACFWTGSQTHVVRGPERAAGALATINLVASAGLLAGPVLAGLLAERGPALALVVAAAVAVVGVPPTLLLDRLPPFVVPADRPAGRLWRRPGVDVGCWSAVTAGAWRALLTSYVPVALDAARQSAGTIGVLVSVANGAQLVGTALAGRIPARWSTRTLGAGIVVTGLATAATAASASRLLLCSAVLVASGVAAGAVQVLGPAAASDVVHPQERGEAIAATGTFRAAALLGAPLAVAGLVLVLPLAPAVALVGAAMALPAAVLRRPRPGLASTGPVALE